MTRRRCAVAGGRHHEPLWWCADRCAVRLESELPSVPAGWAFVADNAGGSFPSAVSVVVPCGSSYVSRVSVARLVALADGMTPRERQIVETVARLTLVSGGQLIDLFFNNNCDSSSPYTRARVARRVLARLVEQRVLDRLARRRGGVGGGSSAWVYALGPAGRRTVAIGLARVCRAHAALTHLRQRGQRTRWLSATCMCGCARLSGSAKWSYSPSMPSRLAGGGLRAWGVRRGGAKPAAVLWRGL